MDDYAVILTGGKQYLVKPDDNIDIEKLEGDKESKIVFDQVLLTNIKGKLTIGKPFITKKKVTAKVVDQIKGKKIRVAKFRAKSRYRKIQGHRQLITRVKILPFAAK